MTPEARRKHMAKVNNLLLLIQFQTSHLICSEALPSTDFLKAVDLSILQLQMHQ